MNSIATVSQIDKRLRETRSGSVWDYVSPSRLNLWLKCPLAFRLRYIDGIRTPTPPALFLGKQVHAGLEWYYRRRQLGQPVGPEDACQATEVAWEEAGALESIPFASSSEEKLLRTKAVELVRAYLQSVRSEVSLPVAVETSVEAPLIDPRTGEDLGIPLLGVIDLVLEDASGPVIVDFKTAARAEQPLDQLHEIQLGCYAYLFRHATGRPESALEIRRLIKTKVPQIVHDRWTARTTAHFGRLFAVIRAYLDDLDRQQMVFRPGLGCSYCDFQGFHCNTWTGSTP